MPLVIKGKLIDKTSPVICVPIVEKNYDDIIAAATKLASKNIDMVEWRADYFDALLDEEERNKILSALKSILRSNIFLVTVRTKKEGGEAILEQDEMEKLLLSIARTRCADAIDVEYFTYANPQPLIATIQSGGALVIASHHDFEKTPSKNVCYRFLEEMGKADPDIVKLCVMPNDNSDVFELGLAGAEFNSKYPQIPTVIISMKDIGVITRIVPGAFSSCISFGAVGKTSAPGQVEYNSLKELIEVTGAFYK